MTHEQFDKFQEALLAEVTKMKDTKGREYSNGADRFGNFNRLATQLDLKNYQIGWVYCTKHLDAIASYMRLGYTCSNESIRGRFIDAITYLVLLAGMVEEGLQLPNWVQNSFTATLKTKWKCKNCGLNGVTGDLITTKCTGNLGVHDIDLYD